jgi:hypothetical protein
VVPSDFDFHSKEETTPHFITPRAHPSSLATVFCLPSLPWCFGIVVENLLLNPLKPKEREREKLRKDSIRVEVKRKHLGESERRYISEGEKEHLVRMYPGNARSSF